MPLKTQLTSLLNIEHPILLAPMHLIAGGKLAAAVSEAGGLGIIGGGYGDPDWTRREIGLVGNSRHGVGFITWCLKEDPTALDVALSHNPEIIMLSFGEDANLASRITKAGIPLIWQVQTVQQAIFARDNGASIVVAQGTEAGGHGGSRSTFPLVPAVVDAISPIPVVAAGGIGDGRGLAAALLLGASGVLIGTRFYASNESLAHGNAKALLVTADGDKTLRSNAVDKLRGFNWPKPYNLRTLTNNFIVNWHNNDSRSDTILNKEMETFKAAQLSGDFTTAAVIAGEVCDLVNTISPAGDIVENIAKEAEEVLASASHFTKQN